MAIIIPSKNIFNITNQKILDNSIDYVSSEIFIPSVQNRIDVETNSFSFNYDDLEGNIIDVKNGKYKIEYSVTENENDDNVLILFSYCRILNETYIKSLDLILSKIERINSFVSSYYEESPHISYSIVGDVITGDVSGIATCSLLKGGGIYYLTFPNITYKITNEKVDNNISFDIEEVMNTHEVFVDEETGDYSISSSIKFSKKINKKISNDKLKLDNVIIGYDAVVLGGDANVAYLKNEEFTINFNKTNGYKKYIPRKINIIVRGDVYEFDLKNEDFIVDFDKTKKDLFYQNSNELFQSTNIPSVKSSLKNIIKQYKNGKENILLLCSISDYFDEELNKVIDIKSNDKMTFNIGDIIIPFRFNENGKDVPISKLKGEAKSFEVISSKISNKDGVVLQEILAQERMMSQIKVVDLLDEYDIKCLYISGEEFYVEDIIVYKGEQAKVLGIEIGEDDEIYYNIAVKKNGLISNSIGKEIAVRIK